MTYPSQHRSPTHQDCANFRRGLCAINHIAVDPNGPVCPDFVPKGAMATRPIVRAYSQARQPYNLYKPHTQSHPLHMPSYPSPTSNSLLPQTWYDCSNRYTDNPTPSTLTAQKASNEMPLSMSRSRGARGMRRGKMGGFRVGPGGSCVCPRCGYTTPHTIGAPCYQQTCPKCGSKMTRGE